jgi:hypothetical protein
VNYSVLSCKELVNTKDANNNTQINVHSRTYCVMLCPFIGVHLYERFNNVFFYFLSSYFVTAYCAFVLQCILNIFVRYLFMKAPQLVRYLFMKAPQLVKSSSESYL